MGNGIFSNLMGKNHWSPDLILDITGKIKDYADKKAYKGVEILKVEDNTWSDPKNQRYDVTIRFIAGNNHLVSQKLLVLRGELLDGETFHQRFKEFY